jgi:hypothetical protein
MDPLSPAVWPSCDSGVPSRWGRCHPPPHRPGRSRYRVAKPLLAFAPTEPAVRRYRSGLLDRRRRDGRLVHTPEVRQQGLPALYLALRPLHCAPFLPHLFSIASLPSATSPILWSGRTPIRGAASCGCPSFAAPTGDPLAADGALRFRYAPFGRDLALAPGGEPVLSPDENRCAAFAGASASSASATSRFRESIPPPIRPLPTLRTPRYRDARRVRSRPAC